ncbi:hypothetical protein BP00DRAFT_434573 [Aspergillus indologenus CBS 114.80]|uniref:Berberine/berberine-like domain-containing protein n=1 Tax=Aspergillus indologenus CBS 114.80 TaxID=1450541 RepID=A0A2V5JCZ4_9EURO|nr:hypothetical protein BP00DRAFT_434573 [Aspergillus indologenus CBS 114.80]
MLPLIFWSALCLTTPVVAGRCKNAPLDVTWPSETDWSSLNASIGGHLLRIVPVAASCWPNSIESHISCNTFYQPDSIDYPIYANNSCLPPNVTGYVHDRGCTTGGLPAYIVNATTEIQIATAMSGVMRALVEGRVVTTGQDPSVGLGLTYGLDASHVLQIRVVTTQGETLVANDAQHQDLFWALRGGGPGLYGVVTDYVLRHHPAPSNALPDLVDAGLAGACMMSTGEAAVRFASLSEATTGVVISQVFWSFNSTSFAMEALVRPVLTRIGRESTPNSGSSAVTITFSTSNLANYTSFISVISGSSAAGSQSVISSRLLGRRELLDTVHTDMTSYLKTALQVQNATAGTFATIGLQGGPGVQQTPPGDWGALLPAWHTACLHFIANGATVDSVTAGSSKRALQDAARWYEAKEHMWQLWAPEAGAYMNETNPFDPEFKRDFYGANYDRLVQVKAKYDLTESLFVLAGVGSDRWDYDLDSGRLCRVS